MERCPLSGQPCPHYKQIHITDVTEDGVKSISICDICSNDYLDNNTEKQSMKNTEDLLLEFLHQFFAASLAAKPNVTTQPPVCPSCHISLSEIAKTGRLGCPNCYQHFQQELDGVLKQAHLGSNKHVGKVPKNWLKQKQESIRQKKEELIKKELKTDPTLIIEEQIRHLEDKMENLIKTENYEIAAQLRDTIKYLKEQCEKHD